MYTRPIVLQLLGKVKPIEALFRPIPKRLAIWLVYFLLDGERYEESLYMGQFRTQGIIRCLFP